MAIRKEEFEVREVLLSQFNKFYIYSGAGGGRSERGCLTQSEIFIKYEARAGEEVGIYNNCNFFLKASGYIRCPRNHLFYKLVAVIFCSLFHRCY